MAGSGAFETDMSTVPYNRHPSSGVKSTQILLFLPRHNGNISAFRAAFQVEILCRSMSFLEIVACKPLRVQTLRGHLSDIRSARPRIIRRCSPKSEEHTGTVHGILSAGPLLQLFTDYSSVQCLGNSLTVIFLKKTKQNGRHLDAFRLSVFHAE